MKAPVVLVTAALTIAIILSASLSIVTGTHGEDALWPRGKPAERIVAPHPVSVGIKSPPERFFENVAINELSPATL